NTRHLHVKVDAVEKRAGNPGTVAIEHGRCTPTPIRRVAQPAAHARVHRSNELEGRRIVDRAAAARDGDATFLERLAERLERVPPELGQLVHEEYPAVGECHLARPD